MSERRYIQESPLDNVISKIQSNDKAGKKETGWSNVKSTVSSKTNEWAKNANKTFKGVKKNVTVNGDYITAKTKKGIHDFQKGAKKELKGAAKSVQKSIGNAKKDLRGVAKTVGKEARSVKREFDKNVAYGEKQAKKTVKNVQKSIQQKMDANKKKKC